MTLTRTEIDTLEKFDLPSRRHVNCIRFDAQSGTIHRLAILQLAEEAMVNSHNFLTRARLETVSDSPFNKDKIVADFVDLSDGYIVEVAVSEGQKSLDRKKKVYEKYELKMIVYRPQPGRSVAKKERANKGELL